MRNIVSLSFLGLLLFWANFSFASSANYNIANLPNVVILKHFNFITQYKNLSLMDINTIHSQPWKKSTDLAMSDVFVPTQGIWINFDLNNSAFVDKTIYLTVENRVSLSSHKLFYIENEKIIQGTLTQYRDNRLATPLKIESQTKISVYLYLSSDINTNTQVKLMTPADFIEQTTSQHLFNGFAMGILACLALVQFILYCGSYNKIFAILSGYFITRTLLLSVALGWNLIYLFPDNTQLHGASIPILISSSIILLLLFSIHSFELSTRHSKLHQTILYLCGFFILYIPLGLWLSPSYAMLISIILYFCGVIIVAILAGFLTNKNVRMAPLLLGNSLFELLMIILLITGLFWYNEWLFGHRNLLFSIGFILNGCIISYIVSRQFFYQHQDKLRAQKRALEHAEASRKAHEALLKEQVKNQEDLEQHVQERTLELNIALQELEDANRELQHKNMIDDLTGLYNRRYYDQKIRAEFRRSSRNLLPLSLVIIDIDFFKKVNDTYGHIAGDFCLEHVAIQIKHSLKRSADVGCRYGGEEFCLILPDTSTPGAVDLAEGLRRAIEASVVIYKEQKIKFTISCGVATYKQQPSMTTDNLFVAADKALYQAKKMGRNQVQIMVLEQEQSKE